MSFTPGCTTKARARRDIARAYKAGQQHGESLAELRRNNIAFSGPVSNTIVPWHEGLTLAQAILTAHWNGKTAPSKIIFKRGKEPVEIPASQLLSGLDFPLKPGDSIEMVP